LASLIKIKTASLLNPVNTCAKIESVNWNLEEVIKLYPLTDGDYVLIREAQKAICLNYDKENNNHTVGAAVRCKNGKIYTGINVYSLHGACAEQIAIGAALTQGERDFDAIVAVRGMEGEEIIPPCGNCRQILHNYMPECDIILSVNGEMKKIQAKELLPFAYQVEG